ncbi:MAG: hypothetical protein IKW39_00020 [Alphaproteobacteria bacterium]|nr:hypothetical protein [Alphaproteobacteria bacterium]
MSIKVFFISLIIMLIGCGMIVMEYDGELFDIPIIFIVFVIAAIGFYISFGGWIGVSIPGIRVIIPMVLCFVFGINIEYIHDLYYMVLLFCILPAILIMNFIIHKEEKSQEIQKIKKNLQKYIGEQFESLLVKYEHTVCKNNYSNWYKERDCFLDNFVIKEKLSYHHINTLGIDIEAIFDNHWNELIEERSDVFNNSKE